MRNLLISLTFITGLLVSLHAGSYFESQAHGLGLKAYFTSVRGMGMGNAGIAIHDSISLAQYALSQWRHIRDTRFTVGVGYYQNFTDIPQLKYYTSTANFGGLSLAIPLQRKVWVIGFTLYPYTNLDVQYRRSFQTPDVEYEQTISTRGNISKAQFLVVWSPHRRIGLAVAGNYYFGLIRDKFQLQFDDGSFYDAGHEVEYRVKGPGAGIYLDVIPFNPFRLAGFVELPPYLKVRRVFNSVLSTEAEFLPGRKTFPLKYGIGGALALSERWTLVADYVMQEWSKGFGLEKEIPENLDDWFNLGVGLERQISRKRDAGFFSRLDWRVGFSIQQLGYKFNGNSVYQYAAHFGMGIPFFFYISRLDVGIVAGVRGDRVKNGAQERFINLRVSISTGERWFLRFR
ncbi:MAG: hypothetical protein GXO78_07155 [Calditrichaeota bacterium]|nr:hypothetical protein [Calditrichota bacterium]